MRLQLQTESSECGLACLSMVASHYGYHADLVDLRRQFSISAKGATLTQLTRHAGVMNFSCRPLRLELDELSQLALPCILHWNLNHFVVLKEVKKNWQGNVVVTLLDPAVGECRLSMEEVSKYFTGVALEVTPSPDFKPRNDRRKLAISDLTGQIFGLRRALVQVLLLALALEIFALATPLLNQFVIDEVIVSGDHELLGVLVAGFGLLLVTQTSISLARSWFLARWSMDVGYQWSGRVFGHLIRLPITFFEKRHLGDVMSRFSSTTTIQSTLTSLFLESALDGLMALLALGMMLLYSPKLTVLVLIAVAVYALLRWGSYRPFRDASQERLILSAKENTHFLETLRAMTPLKLYGREDERRARWQNLKMDVQNRDVRTQKMAIVFKASSTAIFGVQNLALLYIGAGLVMDNVLSIGMLMTFTSYGTTFSNRVFSLIDLFVNTQMLSMHGERLAGIVMEEREDSSSVETDLSRIRGNITLKKVKFRYAEGEPWVLSGIDMVIPAGQSLALVGASGCGKTTLCKIIMGLLKPTEGEVLVDDIPVAQLGMQSYRQLVGTVMQDDVLLAGSILDNISFFDAHVQTEEVERCARLAAIHDEIRAMPMGYQTLVGDMGSSLSGGQKQRVLLARAVYKRPRILALDEATSHLDIENEHKVNEALSAMNVTRIMVAHRPETIKAAQRVVSLRHGKTHEQAGGLTTGPEPLAA